VSFRTIAVELDHGHILPWDRAFLPPKAAGLLTILTPTQPDQPRPNGLVEGLFKVANDFNDPLPEGILLAFELVCGLASLTTWRF
jgi:hypothetical protein